MKNALEKRLGELQREFESGQKMLAELDAKQSNIRTTLLRISGAIQVLEEILAKPEGSGGQEFEMPAADDREQAPVAQKMAV